MDSQIVETRRASVEPLPDNIASAQPGGGFGQALELAWAQVRRAYLKRLFPGYVTRQARTRRGSTDGAPHEIIDSRDLKYCRPLCDCDWPPEHDPYAWRRRAPLAHWGWIELQLFGWLLLAATVAALLTWWWLAPLPAMLLGFVVAFFRDPNRAIPKDERLFVSPADGRVVEVSRLPHEEFVGGPAVRVGIFLSVFNVHVNRVPCESRVIRLRYQPGKFLNALRAASAAENESLTIGLEEEAHPYRRFVVRQIAGAIARRIVCELRPGEVRPRGDRFGMIKFGSRTELIIPDETGLEICVTLGQTIRGGTTIVARYAAAAPNH